MDELSSVLGMTIATGISAGYVVTLIVVDALTVL